MAAELIAQGSDRLHRGGVVLTGDETREDGGADGGDGNSVVDGLFDGPAPLAGILDEAIDILEFGVLSQGTHEQFQQPGPHHGAALPGLEYAGNVGDQVAAFLQQFIAFGV